jgi:hypothetical protein
MGPDHPHTIITLGNYAALLNDLDRAEEAAVLNNRANGDL